MNRKLKLRQKSAIEFRYRKLDLCLYIEQQTFDSIDVLLKTTACLIRFSCTILRLQHNNVRYIVATLQPAISLYAVGLNTAIATPEY